jgi:hypothetical protein
VACSDANAAAVVDIGDARSRVEGFIPTGWYPTAVRALANGTLVILNGKGLRSYPNAENGPNPSKRPNPLHAGEPAPPAVQYVGRMQTGTASWIEPFTVEQLNQWTARTLANSPYRDQKLDETSPLPKIDHVIYIVKENRSYDQVLGDLKPGNGDPSLVLFGENSTPNLHKLAREFVLLDNFYVNSDVSAWAKLSAAAIAPTTCRRCGPTSTPTGALRTISKSRTPHRYRLPGISGPMPTRPASPYVTSATWSITSPTPLPAPSRSAACATRSWPR